jgi:putative AdoMet-dependent methyltransferase
MKSFPEWYFDEGLHAGINYSDEKIVADYDKEHTKFRNYENETSRIIQAVGISKDDIVVDMGCGTGGLSTCLAKSCKKLYAIDISPKMIELCKDKIKKENIDNVFPICSGLLSYEHDGEPADVVISNVVLHHLPDFWKLVALKKINDLLKPGGKFFLFDVIFSFPVEKHKEHLSKWIEEINEKAGEKMMKEAIIHVKEEYSTWDWILERMFELAGFKIVHKIEEMANITAYICLKGN